MDDPTTWPQSGPSGPTIATIALDQAEVHTLGALGDFHCDDEFEIGQWPYDPDALQRLRDKLPSPDESRPTPVAKNHDETEAPRNPILLAFRELIIAAEAAGWDIGDNQIALDQARGAYAELRANGCLP